MYAKQIRLNAMSSGLSLSKQYAKNLEDLSFTGASVLKR